MPPVSAGGKVAHTKRKGWGDSHVKNMVLKYRGHDGNDLKSVSTGMQVGRAVNTDFVGWNMQKEETRKPKGLRGLWSDTLQNTIERYLNGPSDSLARLVFSPITEERAKLNTATNPTRGCKAIKEQSPASKWSDRLPHG